MTRMRDWAVVDAFADRPFTGNPAAVLQFDAGDDVTDDLLRRVAAEANLSETAFLWLRPDDRWDLRWFTPTTEVALCGHATLASAHVLFDQLPGRDSVEFVTRSDELVAHRTDDGIRIDLPALPSDPEPDLVDDVAAACGARPDEVRSTRHDPASERNVMAVFDDAATVRDLAPDMARIATLAGGVIVTAPGDTDDVDCVSRYFTPQHGIPEDPVTGSAHCTIGPYWADRLEVESVRARQVSSRGGDLSVRPDGDRVHLTGRATTVVHGRIRLP